MQTYQISTEMHDFCRTFQKDLTKPQQNRLKELLHGTIRGEEAILSKIAKQNRSKEGAVVRRQVQQYSDMLLKMPLEMMVFRKLKAFKAQIQGDTPIYCDLVDITKKSHKGMELIGSTWNGSEGKPGEGYEMIDVSILQGEIGTTMYRHMFSTAEEGYRSQIKEMEKVFETMRMAWGEIRGTWFWDRGEDSDKMINLCIDYEATFVIRMNVNRGERDRLLLAEDKEAVKMMNLWGKPQGMTLWQDKKKKRDKRLVQLQWRKIWWEYEGGFIPLWLVWSHRKGDAKPAVFLTSRRIENETQAAKVYHQYFDRGKEEAVFKCHKDKLGMEKVRLRSFKKVKQLMMVYVLVDQLLCKIYLKALEVGSVVRMLLKSFLKRTQSDINKWVVIDWYDELYDNLERFNILFKRRYRRRYPASQPSLFRNPFQKW